MGGGAYDMTRTGNILTQKVFEKIGLKSGTKILSVYSLKVGPNSLTFLVFTSNLVEVLLLVENFVTKVK
jgi:hypothetical protein